MPPKKDPKLERAGVDSYNTTKKTTGHPTKSHVVVAKVGTTTKLIRFGQQGRSTAGKPKEGQSEKKKKRRKESTR